MQSHRGPGRNRSHPGAIGTAGDSFEQAVGIEPTEAGVAHQPVTLNRLHQVPPSGIEPEPLGLQPSAQTSYARVGYALRATLRRHAAPFVWVLASTLIVIALQLSEIAARRAQGAPRAAMRPRRSRTHLSRLRSRVVNSRISSRRNQLSLTSGTVRPETSKGRLVFPGGPSVQRSVRSAARKTSAGTQIKPHADADGALRCVPLEHRATRPRCTNGGFG